MSTNSRSKSGAEALPPPAETPTTLPPQSKPAEKGGDKAKTQAEKKEGKESNVPTKTSLETLGSVLAYDLEQLLTIFGEFYGKMIDYDYSQLSGGTPQAQLAALKKLEDKIKVPLIKDKNKLSTSMERAKPGDKLVDYLYKALKLSPPRIKDIKPPTEKVELQHLTKQLKDSGVYLYEGNNAIMDKMLKNPSKPNKQPKYRVGDMVVLRGTNGKFTAGLVLAINKDKVVFQNNELKPVERKSKDIFLAYHFHGNTKMIPEELPKS